jgi:hypothetical protein
MMYLLSKYGTELYQLKGTKKGTKEGTKKGTKNCDNIGTLFLAWYKIEP